MEKPSASVCANRAPLVENAPMGSYVPRQPEREQGMVEAKKHRANCAIGHQKKEVPHKPNSADSASTPHDRLDPEAMQPRMRAMAPGLVAGRGEGSLLADSLSMRPGFRQIPGVRGRVARFCPCVARAVYFLRRKVREIPCACGHPSGGLLIRK